MPESIFHLEHLNLPARDPNGLAAWYSKTFGLKLDGNKARGAGVLIVFQPGEPVKSTEFHFGLRVASMTELQDWAATFSATITMGAEFNAFRAHDPEGNCVELYCKATS
jgi:catechol-2,3-dioxygenase